MRRFLVMLLLAMIALPAWADVKAPDPIPQRVARSAVIVSGKVKSIEDKTVELESYPGGKAKATYSVAVITGDTLVGGKRKEYRVAFLPSNRRFPHLNLKADQGGVFFLTAFAGQSTYRIWSYEDMIPNTSTLQYAAELAEVKRCAKLLADPDKGLTAKKEDRFLTAAMLVLKYRTVPIAPENRRAQEKVPAAQSKKVLQALAEGDWDTREGRFGQLTPQTVFARLGPTEKDGWKPPQDFTKFGESAQKWLKDNAGKYEMKRWVVKQKKDDPEPEK